MLYTLNEVLKIAYGTVPERGGIINTVFQGMRD